MTVLLFALAILFQGIPVQAQQSGTVTGVLRDIDGKPMPNARVAAIPQPQDSGAIPDAGVMSALAETDAEGRYRLENVPPGQELHRRRQRKRSHLLSGDTGREGR
jgi:hypothetical protein